MNNRYVSDPLNELLQCSGLSPDKIDKALERLARQRQRTFLPVSHVYLRQIRQHTNIRVVSIRRLYRRLLVQIEQADPGRPPWHYFEYRRTDCVFKCAGVVPHTVGSAMIGKPLQVLAVPTVALGSTIIHSVEQSEGWLTIDVTPGWRQF